MYAYHFSKLHLVENVSVKYLARTVENKPAIEDQTI